ncbi:MAG: thiamine diphosphokinase [Dehalococcoidia bacterium]
MRALIFANGEAPSAELVEQVHQPDDLVFAADGGARHALACGLVPDAVIGDLDSVDDAIRKAVPSDRFHRVSRLDITDLEKAVAFALAQGITAIEILGASGGRSDHALANLSVLVTNRGAAAIRVHDEMFEVSLVDGSTTIEAPAGTVVSLVALGECTGVTTQGLRWQLADFTLPFGPRGIHNEIATSPARVSVRSGDLLLFKGRWIEKHA